MRKVCHKCKTKKPFDQFPRNVSRRDGRSETCLSCKRKYNRNHYLKNVAYYVRKAEETKRNIRRWLKEYKIEHGCKHCGETHVACLQFHHRNGNDKKFELSQSHLSSWVKVKEEVAKCDVLCANCHAKEHYPASSEE